MGATEIRRGFFPSFHLMQKTYFLLRFFLLLKKKKKKKKKEKQINNNSVFTKREVLPGFNAQAQEDLAEAILIAVQIA